VRLRGTLITLGKAFSLDPASSARLEAAGAPADDHSDAVREYAAKRDRPRDPNDAEPISGRGFSVFDYVKQHRGAG
jgi:hypothetical protein